MPASCEREPAPVEGGEHVQRDRQDLEREEHDDQVVRRRHHDHAGRREEHQREVLGPLELLRAAGSRTRRAARASAATTITPLRKTPNRRPRPCPPRVEVRPVVGHDVPLHHEQHACRHERRASRARRDAKYTCEPCRTTDRSRMTSSAAGHQRDHRRDREPVDGRDRDPGESGGVACIGITGPPPTVALVVLAPFAHGGSHGAGARPRRRLLRLAVVGLAPRSWAMSRLRPWARPGRCTGFG